MTRPLLMLQALALAAAAVAAQPALTVVPGGVLLRAGKPYRAIGVNYFDAFYRTIPDPQDTSYEAGFQVLQQHGIPFIRFCGSGFWPVDWKPYLTDRNAYFERLDRFVRAAEAHGIGLIPSLFWNSSAISDLSDEPWGA